MECDRALEAQVEVALWWKTPLGIEYGQSFSKVYPASKLVSLDGRTLSNKEAGAVMAVMESQELFEAETFFVSRDICTVIEKATDALTPCPLYEDDIFVPSGFAYFEEPLRFNDALMGDAPCRAICWRVFDSVVVSRGDVSKPIDDPTPRRGIMFTMYIDIVAARLKWGEMHPVLRKNLEGFPSLLLFEHSGWAFDNKWEIAPPDWTEFTSHMVEPGVGRLRLYLLSFWRFVKQEIFTRVAQRPSRPVRRRLERKDIKIPTLSVITLRRVHPKCPGSHHDVDWTHRWMVRGHWRNQWLPSKKRHEKRWIYPFVKGPDDKPLVVKDKIFAVTR